MDSRLNFLRRHGLSDSRSLWRGMEIGRKGMMFCDEANECAERVECMQRMRNDIWRISLERPLNGFEVLLDFLPYQNAYEILRHTGILLQCKVKAVR